MFRPRSVVTWNGDPSVTPSNSCSARSGHAGHHGVRADVEDEGRQVSQRGPLDERASQHMGSSSFEHMLVESLPDASTRQPRGVRLRRRDVAVLVGGKLRQRLQFSTHAGSKSDDAVERTNLLNRQRATWVYGAEIDGQLTDACQPPDSCHGARPVASCIVT